MILAIESATPHASVALVRGGRFVGEALLEAGRQASETFLSAIDGLLKGAGVPATAVAHVAVSAGPGSFTGLRVGMAAAKGFCVGWGIPIVPVPTLHALAARFPVAGATICPVLDAKKKEVYAAFFRWEGGECVRICRDMAIAPEALPAILPPGDVFFCGDAVAPFGPVFREKLGDRALFPPEGDGFPRASAVGLLAARLVGEGKTFDPSLVVPAYIRLSEAEVKLKTR